ncbi:hypothetical protein LCGC14_1642610 [marine sediment metagenome]|uniref:HNH nuclease domain-containing protein n=1 Tax=marine sediment metagenome TaxID=412755 RepID=A0A0F9HZ31_9ZZZZ
MAKKKSRRKLIKELDILFSKIVRHGGKCSRCGSRIKVQCAHVFSRRNMSVRWDFDNALPLCWRCHFWWAHKEPVEFNDYIRERMGLQAFYNLKARRLLVAQWTQSELLALKDEFKETIRGQNDA